MDFKAKVAQRHGQLLHGYWHFNALAACVIVDYILIFAEIIAVTRNGMVADRYAFGGLGQGHV